MFRVFSGIFLRFREALLAIKTKAKNSKFNQFLHFNQTEKKRTKIMGSTSTNLSDLIGTVDMDAQAAELASAAFGGGKRTLGALPEGKTVLRVLPPRKGQNTAIVKFWQHSVNVPGQPTGALVVCPQKAGVDACPICEKYEELMAEGTEESKKAAKQYAPKLKGVMNVVRRAGNGQPEEGPLVWIVGQGILRDLNELMTTNDPDISPRGNFAHPTQGFDIVITRKGKGQFDTKYTVKGRPGTDAIYDDMGQMEATLRNLHDLSRYTKAPTANEVLLALSGRNKKGGDNAGDQI